MSAAVPDRIGKTLVVNGRTLEDVTSAERVLLDRRPPRPAAPTGTPEAVVPPAPVFRVTPTPPGPDGRPRAPRREVELPIPGYDGFRVWVWANYPRRFNDDLVSGDEARTDAALRAIIVEHNGWCGSDGEPYPPAAEPGFWHALPDELARVLANVIRDARYAFPNSLPPAAGS